MQAFTKPTRRATVIAGAAGVALLGAVGIGAAAYADTAPTPGTSASAAAPSTTPSGAPSDAPDGGPGEHTHAPHIGGTVVTVSGSTVTVTDRDGFTRTIELADDATVTKDGAASQVSAITAGEHIEATGTVDSNGTTLDATAVTIGQPTPPKGGPGAAGGHERRDGPDRDRGPAGTDAPTPPTDAPSEAPAAPAAPSDAPAAPSDAPAAPTEAPAAS